MHAPSLSRSLANRLIIARAVVALVLLFVPFVLMCVLWSLVTAAHAWAIGPPAGAAPRSDPDDPAHSVAGRS